MLIRNESDWECKSGYISSFSYITTQVLEMATICGQKETKLILSAENLVTLSQAVLG